MSDLPVGYRWATEGETDSPRAVVVTLSTDSAGQPYSGEEADLAVPVTKCVACEREAEVFRPDPNHPGEQIGFCGFHEPEDT